VAQTAKSADATQSRPNEIGEELQPSPFYEPAVFLKKFTHKNSFA